MPKSCSRNSKRNNGRNLLPQRARDAHSVARTFGKQSLRHRAILNSIVENMPDDPLEMYDYLEEACAIYHIAFNSLLKDIRAACLDGAKWNREEPNTSADNGAFHMWCEDENGNIADPHFKEYDKICKMPDCDPNRKVYHKWSEEQQAEKLRNLIPSIMKVINDNMELNGLGRMEMMGILALNPQFRCCPMNAWCLKAYKRDLKICIGNLGFRSKEDPSKIWWEY